LAVPTDVADADAVEAAAAAVEREFGPIDIWINNALATIFAPLARISAEEYRRATEVTYLGYVFGTMAALRRMLPRNHGRIIQVGSALAYRAIPLQAPYCGAKHAIRGFTDSVRCELMHEGSNVQITMVQMPALNTPQFDWARNKMSRRPRPMGAIFQPEVAAEAIVYAAHARHREVYVGGSTRKAVLGNKLLPGLFDHFLARHGYEAQLSAEAAVAADDSDNLFVPPGGDRGAHGRFDDSARPLPRFWTSEGWGFLRRQRRLVSAGIGAVAGMAALVLVSRAAARETLR
jgi:NAD(P)-dependent dehydrogenase (short-subunit alcohol dehydrogenase family)